jgi:hypothetical protein
VDGPEYDGFDAGTVCNGNSASRRLIKRERYAGMENEFARCNDTCNCMVYNIDWRYARRKPVGPHLDQTRLLPC